MLQQQHVRTHIGNTHAHTLQTHQTKQQRKKKMKINARHTWIEPEEKKCINEWKWKLRRQNCYWSNSKFKQWLPMMRKKEKKNDWEGRIQIIFIFSFLLPGHYNLFCSSSLPAVVFVFPVFHTAYTTYYMLWMCFTVFTCCIYLQYSVWWNIIIFILKYTPGTIS